MCPRAVHERVATQLNRRIVDFRRDIPAGDKAPNRRRFESDGTIFCRDARRAQRVDERVKRFPIRFASALDEVLFSKYDRPTTLLDASWLNGPSMIQDLSVSPVRTCRVRFSSADMVTCFLCLTEVTF